MSSETQYETEVLEAPTDEIVDEEKDLWDGGKEPFKASYGKIMMWFFLVSDAFSFAGLLITYATMRMSETNWPEPSEVFQSIPWVVPHGLPLVFVTIMTFILIMSSVFVVRAVQEGHRMNQRGVLIWMGWGIVGGLAFLGCQAMEWSQLIFAEHLGLEFNPFFTDPDGLTQFLANIELPLNITPSTREIEFLAADATAPLRPGDLLYPAFSGDLSFYTSEYLSADFVAAHAGDSHHLFVEYLHNYKAAHADAVPPSPGPVGFGNLFFTITGFHGFHVTTGVLINIIIWIQAYRGVYQRRGSYEMVEKVGLYWHFVDLVWVFVFLAFYLL